MVTKTQVDNAFAKLKAAGYFAEQNFWCCQSCGWNAIPEGVDKVVFYHEQDNEAWDNYGCHALSDKLYLAWSGDCREIREILESEGLVVEHDGSDDSRIIILP